MRKKSTEMHTPDLFSNVEERAPTSKPKFIRPELDQSRLDKFIASIDSKEHNYQCSYPFNRKRITPDVVRSMADFIYHETRKLYIDYEQAKFGCHCINGSSCFESNPSIFENRGILEQEQISHIYISIKTPEFSIEVNLLHTHEEDKKNCINVSGHNRTWVYGILYQLVEILNRSQSVPKIKDNLAPLFAGLGIICVVLAIIFAYTLGLFLHWNALATTGLVLWCALILLGAFYGNRYFKKLWPEVELITGPSHFQHESVSRERLRNFWLTLILPILISTACNIATSIYFMNKDSIKTTAK